MTFLDPDPRYFEEEPPEPRRHITVPLVLLCFLVVAGIGLYWMTHG